MSDFTIKPATRTGVKPLVGFYGKSGSGKTYSALLYARGLVGPTGKITLVDSESGRGSLFADIPEIGGYGVIELEPPFSPERYDAAITSAEAASDIVVVDSLTHEWNGEGGVLDMQEAELDRMAGENYSKREACKMAAWIKPKIQHKKFIARLLRLKCGLIVCLRGEEKTHIVKDDKGKNQVVTDKFSMPIFDSRFLFELLITFETVLGEKDEKTQGGFVYPTKVTHPAIVSLLPKPDEQITVAHGTALAAWCAGKTTTPTQPAAMDPKIGLMKQIRDRTEHIHGWTARQGAAAWATAKPKLAQWLADELKVDVALEHQTAEELQATLNKVKEQGKAAA